MKTKLLISYLSIVVLTFFGISETSAAIVQRGAATTATTTGTTLTINKPTGVVQGDVLIVNIAQTGNNTTAPTNSTSGWTLIDGRTLAGGTARYGAVLYRVAGASESTNYTFTLGGGVSSAVGSIVAFSGVVTNPTPFDVAPGTISVQASSTAVAAASITTATANAAVIMFGMAAASAPTWSGWTTATSGALVELFDNQSTTATVGAAWRTNAATGATGAGAATLSAGERNGGILIALRPITLTATTTTVATSGTPTNYGNLVTFTATVTPTNVVNGSPVNFFDGATLLGSGTISGTTNKTATYTTTAIQLSAASHSITAAFVATTNFAASTSAAITQVVSQKPLTVSGLTGVDRNYNGTLTTRVTTNGYAFTGVISPDVVTLTTNGYTATFADKNVGVAKPLTIAGFGLGGAQGTNYSLTQPTNVTASINATNITVTALTNTKTYDGSTNAAAIPTISANGLQAGDSNGFSEDYTNALVGTSKPLVPTGAVNDGNGGANYNVTFVNNNTGVINAKALTVTGITADDLVYDGTTNATLSGTAALQASEAEETGTTADGKPYTGDDVSLSGTVAGAFADPNVGNGKPVTVTGLSLTGAEAANYILIQPTNLTANIVAAPGSQLAFGVQPTDTVQAAAISPAVTVRILDPYGNLATNTTSVTVAIGNNPGGGTLSGTLTVAAVGGTATFTNLSINNLGTNYTLAATAPGLTGTNSTGFNITAAATKLVITTAPQVLTAGSNSTVITVQIQDASGNPVNTTTNRTITLTTSSAGATFRNLTNGVITTITLLAGSNSTNYLFNATLAGLAFITNTTPGLTAAVQTEVVNPGSAIRLLMVTQPSATATAGVAFAQQPVVRVVDLYSNTVTTFGAGITATQTSGGYLNANPAGITVIPAGGVANFSGLFLTNAGVSTLTFTASGVSNVISSSITVSAAAATQVGVETLANGTGTIVPAQNVLEGTSITVYAIARDFYGNFVTNIAADSWSLVNLTGSVLSGDLVPVAGNKSAVFTGHVTGSASVHVTSGVLNPTDSGTLTVIRGTNDPDLPDPSANYQIIPAGSYVIPMDTNYQALLGGTPFNLKAYGLVNRLLQNDIPVRWAIRAGKTNNGVDFSAWVSRIAPTVNGTVSNLNFAGGPFIVDVQFTNQALPFITNYGNSVAVYRVATNTIADIRHDIRFRPKIAINNVNPTIHTALLDYVGISNYTVTNDFSLLSNTCYTLFLEPHNDSSTNGVGPAKQFVQHGGNFLAQCLSVAVYENAAAGHFQSTSNISTNNLTTALFYPNPDLPYAQLVGGVTGDAGNSVIQDWRMNGPFINNGHVYLDDNTNSTYAATESKHSVGPGGLVFYLGGHNYYTPYGPGGSGTLQPVGSGVSNITFVNGMRMLLNAVFIPANRPSCVAIDFGSDLGITVTHAGSVFTNGQPITLTVTVDNNAFDSVLGAAVTNIFPAGLTNVTWTSTATAGATNYNPSGAGNIITTLDLPADGEVVFTVQANISPATSCLITNVATVTLPFGVNDANTNDNYAADLIHIIQPFSPPPAVQVSCTNQIPAAATNATAFTNQGGSVSGGSTVSWGGDASNGGAGCPASPLILTRNYQILSGCGDTGVCSQVITVIDSTPPLVNCSGDKETTLTNVWSFNPPTGSSDGCSGTNITVTVIATVTNNNLCGAGFTATRTWSVADACGNSTNCSQNVTVTDPSAPVIACVSDKTVQCGSGWDFDAPNAGTNAVTVVGTVTNSAGHCGSTFAATRTWQAINSCGFFSQCSQTVTVVDTNPPVIVCVTNHTVEFGTAPAFDTPTNIVDGCDTNVTLAIVGTVTNTAAHCGQTFDVTRTWRATDACSNSATCSQTIFVVDTTPPVITCVSNKTAGSASAWTFDVPTASDAADGTNVTIAVLGTVTNNVVCADMFDATRTWSATDACGNSNTCSQTVTVVDTTLPQIGCPDDITVTNALGQCGSNVTFVVTASDNCGTNSLVSEPPSGYAFPVGVTTVTNTVTDINGNSNVCTFTITVTDTESPIITCPSNVIVDANAPGSTATNVALGTPQTADNCTVAAVTNDAPASFPTGTNVVAWIVTDDAGNTNTCQQLVIVRGNPPSIACPTDVIVSTDTNSCFATGVNLGDLVISNDCGTVTVTNDAPTSYPVGTNLVIWLATNSCGKTDSCTQLVIVQDTQLPQITCPAGITNAADAGLCFATLTLPVLTNVFDNCGIASVTSNAPPTFDVGTTNVIWTVTDVHGNYSTCTQQVTVIDDQPPVFTLWPTNGISVNAALGSCASNVTFVVTAADNCATNSLTSSPASGSSFPVGTTTVTNVVTDTHGNSTTNSFTVTVTDTQPPVFTLWPTNGISVNAALGSCASNVTFVVTAADNCATNSLTSSPASGSSFPVGTTTVTNVVTDTHGNSTTNSFTVTVADTQPPVFTLWPTNGISVNAALGSCASNVTFVVTATDNCATNSLTSSPASGSSFPVGTTTVTNVVTDTHGNSTTNSFTVTVADTQPPVFTLWPTNGISVNAALGSCASNVTFVVTAADNCATNSLTSSPASGSSFPVGTTTVTNVVTDTHGNSTTNSFTVTVTDTQPPVFTLWPTNGISVNAALGSCASNVTFVVTAADNCATNSLTSSPASGSSFPVGTTTVTNVVTDTHGNSTTNSFTVTVTDTQPPVFTLWPTNGISVNAALGSCASNVTFVVTATDNCATNSLTSSPASGSSFPVGTTTVTNVVTDTHGNSTTNSFTVTVADTQPPVFTLWPTNGISVNAALGSCASNVTFVVTAADNCATNSLTSSPASGSSFPVGTTTVTNVVTDTHGNSTTNSFTVTVTDTQPPVFTLWPTNGISVNAALGSCASNVTFVVTAADNCATNSLTSSPASGSSFPVGTTTVTNVVTDTHGNSTTNSFTVTVTDTQPPVFTLWPTNGISVNAALGSCASNVTFVVTAADNCATNSLTSSPASGSSFPVGTTTVTNVVTDTHGNSTTNSFTVTVTDTQPPVFTLWPTNGISVNAALGSCASNVTFVVTAADNCATNSLTSSPASGSSFPVGTTTVTNVVTDTHGNSTTNSFTVTVTDTQPPVFTLWPTNGISVNAALGSCASNVTFVVTAADNCATNSLTSSPASGSSFPVGTTTVTNVVTDTHGNSTTNSFTVTVTDTQPPVFTLWPTNGISVNAALGSCASNVTFVVTAADNCATNSLTSSPASGSSFPVGTTTVTNVVTDTHGNSTTNSFTVTVTDTQPPVFTLWPTNGISVNAALGSCASNVTFVVTAADNCATNSLTSSPASGSSFPVGTTTVTNVVTDTHGNSTTNSFTVTVLDTPPTAGIISPANGTEYFTSQSIQIIANVVLGGCPVTNVQFFWSGNSLGQTTNIPYSITWTNLPLGTYQLTAIAADANGLMGTSAPVTITVIGLSYTTNSLTLNPQTSLYEQVVTVTNPTPYSLDSIAVLVTNMPALVQLYNQTGTTNGFSYIGYSSPIPPGGSVSLTFKYYFPPDQPFFFPGYLVVLYGTPPPVVVTGTPVFIDLGVYRPNGTFLLNFAANSNETYYIQYTSNFFNWKTSPQSVPGVNSHVQWIDDGPPATESLPALTPYRFYRVIRVP